MSLFPYLPCRSRKQWGLAVVLLLFGMALEAGEAEAQSGRRAAKPSSPVSATPPAPSESPSPEPERPLGVGQLPAKVQLLVARQPTSKHLRTEDQILASFVRHLNQYENIEAASIGDTKEGQAAERAKAETEAFVIL